MSKENNALKHYNGHKGASTVAHVQRNISAVYPDAFEELTGRQYGLVMSVANASFQDGRATAGRNGEIWAYDNPTDWVAGIGPHIPSKNGGHNNAAVITVTEKSVTIELLGGEKIVYERMP